MSLPSTSATLMQRLRQSSHPDEAWQRFVQLYTPLLHHWAKRRLGVQDANDLVQEVLLVLVQRLPQFEYDQGKSFRAWLWTVMRHKWMELQTRRKPEAQADQEVMDEVADEAEAFWEADYREQLVSRALELMQTDFQPATWRACWEVVACSRPTAEVAAELGLTIGAVHAARFRVLTRLREELQGLLD
jgi:RNA polymerase sigma-70 factor, ECF subfamily